MKKGFWWIYDFKSDKFIPKYAYNGAETQFKLEYYGRTYEQEEFMAKIRENSKLYPESLIQSVIDKFKEENEFIGTKSEILKYLKTQDDSEKFLIRKVR